MAEPELAPEQEQETVDAPVEGVKTEPTNDNQDDPVEALARDLGWSPKDQFRGDPEAWKPARDFILAGREIQSGMRNELRTVKDQLSRLSSTSATLLERTLAEERGKWEREHAAAVEEGDAGRARKAAAELTKLDTTPVQPGIPPETQQFMERNKWMGTDPLATTRAKEIADRLAREGHDVPTQLREVERAIRKEFPEHFAPPAKQPAAVTTAGTRAANTTPRVKGFNEMPAESQKMALDYEKRLGIKRDDFAKSYWADQAKAQRRVG